MRKVSVRVMQRYMSDIYSLTTVNHDHLFALSGSKTIMTDIFDYNSPLSFIGRLVDVVFLKKYMTSFFVSRQKLLKKALESDQWKEYIY